MRVALVYDRVNKIGGAERVLEALHEIWPDAPLYTSVYDPKHAPWAHTYTVIPSFLNRIPFFRRHHEYIPFLTPFAFESFSFDAYDVVISVTSAEAKNCITKPETLHICYCLTPTRYLWSGEKEYRKQGGFGIWEDVAQKVYRSMLPILRSWDLVSAKRPDIYVAISNHIKKRIEMYYQEDPQAVIYPPTDTKMFVPSTDEKGDYYLLVGRLVPYKHADIVIAACNALQKPLIIIGEGTEKKRLKHLAGPTIRFVDARLTDKELLHYYQKSRAFLYAGDEDFGIVAAEAQSVGRPVIAYQKSGIAEIVIDGKTGILFPEQTVESLCSAIKKSEQMHFSSDSCRMNAKRFSKEQFKKTFGSFVRNAYTKKTISHL